MAAAPPDGVRLPSGAERRPKHHGDQTRGQKCHGLADGGVPLEEPHLFQCDKLVSWLRLWGFDC